MTTAVWNELDDNDEQRMDRRVLREPMPWISSTLLGAGAAVILAVYVYAFAEPVSQPQFSGALFAGGLLCVLGVIVKSADRIIRRIIAFFRLIVRMLEKLDAEVGLRNGQLAAAVEQNNAMMRQLQAARTVDMTALREELRATREYADAVAEASVKKVREEQTETNELIRQVQAGQTAMIEQVKTHMAETYENAYADALVDFANGATNVRRLPTRQVDPSSGQ